MESMGLEGCNSVKACTVNLIGCSPSGIDPLDLKQDIFMQDCLPKESSGLERLPCQHYSFSYCFRFAFYYTFLKYEHFDPSSVHLKIIYDLKHQT